MVKKGVALIACIVLVALFGGCRDKEYVHVGPNWDRVHNLQPSKDSFPVTVRGESAVKIGGKMAFSVLSGKEGQLWVIQVDANDSLSLIFPNDASPDNVIRASVPFSIPPDGASWAIAGAEPVGKSTLAFLVTAHESDLLHVFRDHGAAATGGSGKSLVMDKALALTPADPTWGVGRKVVEVTR
jgi:hypothetical protein